MVAIVAACVVLLLMLAFAFLPSYAANVTFVSVVVIVVVIVIVIVVGMVVVTTVIIESNLVNYYSCSRPYCCCPWCHV